MIEGLSAHGAWYHDGEEDEDFAALRKRKSIKGMINCLGLDTFEAY